MKLDTRLARASLGRGKDWVRKRLSRGGEKLSESVVPDPPVPFPSREERREEKEKTETKETTGEEEESSRRSWVPGVFRRAKESVEESVQERRFARVVKAGHRAGLKRPVIGWAVGGAIFFPLAPLLALSLRRPRPPLIELVVVEEDDRETFALAYGQAAKAKRTRFCWIGAGVGGGIAVLLTLLFLLGRALNPFL